MSTKTHRLTPPTRLVALLVICFFCFISCNVTRTVSTQSQYYQKGDTTCTIVTKTIEQYDASKK